MSFTALGKRIAAAAKAGKDLNKVNLGKYGTKTAAKRSKLADAVKKLKKQNKPQAKLLARHPERFEGSRRTFLTDTEREKMGYPIGQRYLGARSKTDYKRGGKVKKRK
tara:strand:- start:552 stop:875 length:324 start_codon:yes stop_codon:yes gene_type:complete